MNTPALLIFILLGFSALQSAGADQKIRFFTKSQRSEHSVIKREGDKPSFAEKILAGLAKTNHWEIETSKDGRIFTAEKLAKYDALLFYSNGTMTDPGLDGSPVMTEQGKATLIDVVRKGKPFIAADSGELRFSTEAGKALKISKRFKVSEMMYDGKLEY